MVGNTRYGCEEARVEVVRWKRRGAEFDCGNEVYLMDGIAIYAAGAAGVAVFFGVAAFLAGVAAFFFDGADAVFLAGLVGFAGPLVTRPDLVLPRTFFSSMMAGAYRG